MKRKNARNGFFNFFALFVFIAFVAVATVVVDALSCDVNIFFYCNAGGGSGGPGGKPPVTIPATKPDAGKPAGTAAGSAGSGGAICFSAPNAACGIKNQGTIVGGICSAATPPNSSCPAPIIASGTGFYVDPPLVRSGNKAILHWAATNATSCTVSGGGISLSGLGRGGSTDTAPVNAKTVYTLACEDGAGGPVTSANATVNLVPFFQEN